MQHILYSSRAKETEFYAVHFWLNDDPSNYANYLHVNELLLLYGSVSLIFCVQGTNLLLLRRIHANFSHEKDGNFQPVKRCPTRREVIFLRRERKDISN
jgi:hypothetical protein